MGRFKDLMARARNRMASLLWRNKRVKRRLNDLTSHNPKVEGMVRRIECFTRDKRAEALIEEIQVKLRSARDPIERMALYASIDTVRFLARKEAAIPETFEELVKLRAELIVSMYRKCMERLRSHSNGRNKA